MGSLVGALVGSLVGALVERVPGLVGVGDRTALGIFFRFQVTDFDVFCLFLVLHVCYLSFVGLLIDCVGVTAGSNRGAVL